MAKKSAKESIRVGALPLELISPGGEAESNLVSVIIFGIGGERLAIGVEHTEGVVDCPYLTPLPSAPDGIIGVASVRGRMTLVMDLSLGDEINRPRRRLILLKGESQLGLLADYIEDVVALEPKRLRSATTKQGKPAAQKSKSEAQSRWPVRAYFDINKSRIAVIDAEQLAEM